MLQPISSLKTPHWSPKATSPVGQSRDVTSWTLYRSAAYPLPITRDHEM